MPALLVGYDLNAPGQRYDELIAEIKKLGAWWHYLDSTWLIDSAFNAPAARDRLTPFLDEGDKLMVIDVTADWWAGSGFPPDAYEWMKSHLR